MYSIRVAAKIRVLILGSLLTTFLFGCTTITSGNSKDIGISTSKHSGIEVQSSALTFVEDLLSRGDEFRLWVIAPLENVKYHPMEYEQSPGSEWSENNAERITSQLTQGFLSLTGKHPNAHIVDRDYIEYVLQEQQVQLSGIIDSSDAIRIGNIVGANYLLVMSLDTYHRDKDSYVEIERRRLIDLSTGIVVADDKFQIEIRMINGNWISTSMILNGQNFVFGTDGRRYKP